MEKTSTTAVVSLVLGILGIVTFFIVGGICFGLPALALGLFALSQINGSNGALRGKGQAIAGAVTGAVGLLLSVVVVVVGMTMMPVLEKAREKARRVNCAGNLKQIGLGVLMYSMDNGGYMPPDLATLDRLDVLTAGKVYRCPSAEDQGFNPDEPELDTHYVYIGAGLKDDNDNASLVPIAHDQLSNHPAGGWINVLFLDGHVEGVRPDGKDFVEVCVDKGWVYPMPSDGGEVDLDPSAIMDLLQGFGGGEGAQTPATPKDEDGVSHLEGMDLEF